MSIWNNRGFTENELSGPAKLIVGLAMTGLFLAAMGAAAQNAARAVVPRPGAFAVVVCGLVLFLVPKLQVVRAGRPISFGTRHMTESQGNAYRLGYFLMAAGFLLTFS